MLVAVACIGSAGCGSGDVDLGAARAFTGYPLYWLGEEFEGHRVSHLELPNDANGTTVIVYGTCHPGGGDEPSCSPPLQLQLQPLCTQLDAVATSPLWRRREVRGAPVGAIDSAPVLFADGVQVKVYRGEGATEGTSYRALRALRSLNAIVPAVGPLDPIPAADRDVLAGEQPCTG